MELDKQISLIEEGCRLKAQIESDSARLKEIGEMLLEVLPAGPHHGESNSMLIVEPSPAVKPGEKDIEPVRLVLEDDDVFKKLFDRVVSYKPVKGFRDKLAVLVDKRKQKRILALVEKPTPKYIKWG